MAAALYYGTEWGREYYKIKMGEMCSERMWLIENAKTKYKQRFGEQAVINHYSDLLPFLPNTGFPMCPWGGEYANRLDANKQVTCSLNGKSEYEPETPGVNPMANGYQDLAVAQKAMGLYEFFNRENGVKGTNSPKKKKSRLFDK